MGKSSKKLKPKKDSLVDFMDRFSTEEKRIAFFVNMKYPEGYECECGCHKYYLIKRKGLTNNYMLECAKCGHQVSLFSGTILENSKLPLLKILIGLYLFFTSNNGISAIELANKMDVSVKTARRYARKFRILMAESNLEKILNASYYEIDIIEVGGKKSDGRRGKAADKQQVLMTLSTEAKNECPLYIKLHALPNHKAQPIRDYLQDHVIINQDKTVSCDNDPAFKWLKDCVNLENDKVDYDGPNPKLFWLNTMASNFENAIKFIYRRVQKKDLPLYLAEQEYRTNHRYTGRRFFEKISRYIHNSKPVTNRQITDAVNSYRPDEFEQFIKSVM